uniref:Uncharacterized protein n=1 Tax=Trichuris muris TaxID=70415 RepID=A0A5S6QCF0_TRIMR
MHLNESHICHDPRNAPFLRHLFLSTPVQCVGRRYLLDRGSSVKLASIAMNTGDAFFHIRFFHHCSSAHQHVDACSALVGHLFVIVWQVHYASAQVSQSRKPWESMALMVHSIVALMVHSKVHSPCSASLPLVFAACRRSPALIIYSKALTADIGKGFDSLVSPSPSALSPNAQLTCRAPESPLLGANGCLEQPAITILLDWATYPTLSPKSADRQFPRWSRRRHRPALGPVVSDLGPNRRRRYTKPKRDTVFQQSPISVGDNSCGGFKSRLNLGSRKLISTAGVARRFLSVQFVIRRHSCISQVRGSASLPNAADFTSAHRLLGTYGQPVWTFA